MEEYSEEWLREEGGAGRKEEQCYQERCWKESDPWVLLKVEV